MTGSGRSSGNTPPGKKKAALRFRPNYLGAFFRSIVVLGIVGKERFHYWRLLSWTVIRRPRLLHKAVTLAIYGFHFRKVCEKQTLNQQELKGELACR